MPAALPDGQMLLDDAGVLHRHFPAAKINQLGAEFLMGGEKWRAFKHELFNHSGTQMNTDKIQFTRNRISNLCLSV